MSELLSNMTWLFATGRSDRSLARLLRVSVKTIRRWRKACKLAEPVRFERTAPEGAAV
jgi:hypothetical protein